MLRTNLAILAAFVAVAVAPAAASAQTPAIDYEFTHQTASDVYTPLSVHIVTSSQDVKFSLMVTATGQDLGLLEPVHKHQAQDGRTEFDLIIRHLPKLDEHYSICASGLPSGGPCAAGLLTSFYAVDPAFGLKLKVQSSASAIAVHAKMTVRCSLPGRSQMSAEIQQYRHGSWKTLRRFQMTSRLSAGSDRVAATPAFARKLNVPHLKQLLGHDVRYRVVFRYSIATNLGYSVVAGRTTKSVEA